MSTYDRRTASTKVATSVQDRLRTALGAIEYLPNAVAAWLEAHGQNKELAEVNEKKVQQAEVLLGQVLASLPMGNEFQVIGIGLDGWKFTHVIPLIRQLAQEGFKHTGFYTGRGRPELRNAPTFANLVGPMYGGPGLVRYETWDVHNQLSR